MKQWDGNAQGDRIIRCSWEESMGCFDIRDGLIRIDFDRVGYS